MSLGDAVNSERREREHFKADFSQPKSALTGESSQMHVRVYANMSQRLAISKMHPASFKFHLAGIKREASWYS
jgi:hypothetical protein